MKAGCVIVLLVFAVGATTPVVDDDVSDDMPLNERQIFVLKLLNHIMEPVMYKDVQEIGNSYKIEDNMEMYTKTDVLKRFITNMRAGFLPPGEIFCLSCEQHMREVIDMFHVLYFSKDFKTFLHTAAWMRMHINEGMFVYAFTVAIRHRQDCKQLILPSPYEIYPYFFVDADVIKHAFMLKMKQGLPDKEYCKTYGIEEVEKDVFVIDENFRDQRISLNTDTRLTYFTEDIDLNTYHYYFHIDFPFWMSDDMMEPRHGEVSYYTYQQLLARYHLERLSHNMCEGKSLSLYKPLRTGFWPNMNFHNGIEMPMRYNNYMVFRDDNADTISLIEDYEKLIRESIIKGFILMHDGTMVDLRKPVDMEYLARMTYGKVDKYHGNFNRYLIVIIQSLFGLDTMHHNGYMVLPTILDQFQTALRDPLYWQLQKRLMDHILQFKMHLLPYSLDELYFAGVKVDSIVVDKLVTYFDDFLMDMTNVVTLSAQEVTKAKSDITVMVRKRRLNHQPFTITIEMVSDKTVDSVVRIFLGPKTDCMERIVTLNENRLNFVEIDTFIKKLINGKNTITRKSTDMHNLVRDRLMTRDWMMNLDSVINLKAMTVNDMKNMNTGFPMRLLLPKGRVGGMELMMFVIVSPLSMSDAIDTPIDDFSETIMNSRYGMMFDRMPLGFPLDRRIDTSKFVTPNMKFMEVMVFHRNTACDMKTRWQMHVLRSYDLYRKTLIDEYTNDTDVFYA